MSEPRRIAVLGLARSGRAAALLALARGLEVYASDAADTPTTRDAVDAIRAAGGRAQTGAHDIAAIAECELLVVSPGIPPTAPVLADERVARVPQVSELEFGSRWLRSRVVAVTGTNGKTTVTSLVAHLLGHAGVNTVAAGNIGLPLSEIARADEQPEVVVAEASSFQLAGIDRFDPEIGVLTNLAGDHLDRYPSVEAYYADKQKLFRNAHPDSRWILNADDPRALELAGDSRGLRWLFSLAGPLPDGQRGAWRADDELFARLDPTSDPVRLVRTRELGLIGPHNHANALAASLAALLIGVAPVFVREGLRTFAPLEHRMQPVIDAGGVLWVNDSKATNLDSTRVALRGLDRSVVLLLGGRHKGEPYTGLLDDARGRVRVVVAYGEAAPIIEADLGPHLPVVRVDGAFESVLDAATQAAQPGDVVLLSPACSSYDMFTDFEDRGRRFSELARRIAARGLEVANGA
ncbi:MAG TPA: UDP-N-acetylmuramoyl-L-alanine--D-glutamate ligase [Longimicrobiales bacterium]|nr:UDP-N-acetylmuramoyl-L-alanine--D-glutamate ligase [Longimicrobiales bacterium]